MYHIAGHGVAAGARNLLPLHLVVEVVRMVLADIVVPSCGTSCRTGDGIVDAVLEVHIAHSLKTLVCDDVVAEDVKIFLYERTEVLAELLYVLHEVRVDVGLQSAYSVVVLYQTPAGCLLHDVEHLLTVSHAV